MALQLKFSKTVSLVNHLVKRLSVTSQARSVNTTPTKPTTTPAAVNDDDEEMNKPIQYSTSPAAQWAARHSFAGENADDVPWFQPHVVTVSSLAFIIYFLYLREANDIDAIFDRELGDYFDTKDPEELKRKIGRNTEMAAFKR